MSGSGMPRASFAAINARGYLGKEQNYTTIKNTTQHSLKCHSKNIKLTRKNVPASSKLTNKC